MQDTLSSKHAYEVWGAKVLCTGRVRKKKD